jgi:hypothetical protein
MLPCSQRARMGKATVVPTYGPGPNLMSTRSMATSCARSRGIG